MAVRSRLHLVASRVHKWLALIVGAQLLIWFASGALMSFLPIKEVRGEHLVDRETVAPISTGTAMASPDQIIALAGAPVEAMTWRMMDGKPVVEAVTASGTKLFDAQSGAALAQVDAATATRIAKAAWRAGDKPQSFPTMVSAESTEYRGALPAWRIAFADPEETSVFVAAETGRITAVRTGTWRLYDFFWGLHIMDWKNHEDFNSPWLLGFAIGGLILGIAGTILLVLRWPFRRKAHAE